MPGKITATGIKVVIREDVEEVLKRKVTPFGTGAKVGCPKEHIGKSAYLVVCRK